MDPADIHPLLEDLEGNVDDLEDALGALLKTPLSISAGKLPLLDRAKLYVLVTYAIESILFSFLKLSGVDTKEHSIMKELLRVRQYFEKVKAVENGPAKRENLSLNKDAAGRFIKHALAGNDKYDQERTQRQAEQKAAAKLKFEKLTQNQPEGEPNSRKRKARKTEEPVTVKEDASSSESDSMSSSDSSGESSSGELESASEAQATALTPPKKKQRTTASAMWNSGSARESKPKREKACVQEPLKGGLQNYGPDTQTQQKRINPPHKSSQPPRNSREALEALLKGPLPKREAASKKDQKYKNRKSKT